MSTIKVNYEVTNKIMDNRLFGSGEVYGIKGIDMSTGDTFEAERVSFDKVFTEKIVSILTDNQVSVLHAKDVIKDLIADTVCNK